MLPSLNLSVQPDTLVVPVSPEQAAAEMAIDHVFDLIADGPGGERVSPIERLLRQADPRLHEVPRATIRAALTALSTSTLHVVVSPSLDALFTRVRATHDLRPAAFVRVALEHLYRTLRATWVGGALQSQASYERGYEGLPSGEDDEPTAFARGQRVRQKVAEQDEEARQRREAAVVPGPLEPEPVRVLVQVSASERNVLDALGAATLMTLPMPRAGGTGLARPVLQALDCVEQADAGAVTIAIGEALRNGRPDVSRTPLEIDLPPRSMRALIALADGAGCSPAAAVAGLVDVLCGEVDGSPLLRRLFGR